MRILVIEDEHRIANNIKKGLEQEKYIVDVAYEGNYGYDLAEGEEYDLIILDLMLLGLDGLTICKNLRAENKQTPIIMLTAKSQIQDKIKGLESGADDYLSKPFSFEELLARIHALLRRPNKILSNNLSVSDLTLNTNQFTANRDNVEIKLSNKEFALLEYLMRNSGLTLTKEQIISHVWNYDSDVLENTVEVFIKSLRQKIDKPFTKLKPLIQTIRGFGYRLG